MSQMGGAAISVQLRTGSFLFTRAVAHHRSADIKFSTTLSCDRLPICGYTLWLRYYWPSSFEILPF